MNQKALNIFRYIPRYVKDIISKTPILSFILKYKKRVYYKN